MLLRNHSDFTYCRLRSLSNVGSFIVAQHASMVDALCEETASRLGSPSSVSNNAASWFVPPTVRKQLCLVFSSERWIILPPAFGIYRSSKIS
jgi:hypothetical protein